MHSVTYKYTPPKDYKMLMFFKTKDMRILFLVEYYTVKMDIVSANGLRDQGSIPG